MKLYDSKQFITTLVSSMCDDNPHKTSITIHRDDLAEILEGVANRAVHEQMLLMRTLFLDHCSALSATAPALVSQDAKLENMAQRSLLLQWQGKICDILNIK